MNRYKIYCTEEQTRKAKKLGAPIERYSCNYNNIEKRHHYVEFGVDWNFYREKNRRTITIIPTAEQMIGWLEEQNIYIGIYTSFKLPKYAFSINGIAGVGTFFAKKEATLAAIDAALEYLKPKN